MLPVLFRIGPLTLYTYGVFLVLAFLVAGGLAVRSAPDKGGGEGLTPDAIGDIIMAAMVGGIIGGRLVFVAVNGQYFLERPAEIIALWNGGLIWYGGFLGGAAGVWLVSRSRSLDFWRLAAHLCPYVALGHAIGRVGCFFNGCCYGKPVDGCCGVRYPGMDQPVLPIQLVEAAGLFLLFITLRTLQRRSPAGSNALVGRYLAGYGLLRFVTEWFRGDKAGLSILTGAQWISLGLIAAGCVLLARSRRPV